jgi:hypothetical protein
MKRIKRLIYQIQWEDRVFSNRPQIGSRIFAIPIQTCSSSHLEKLRLKQTLEPTMFFLNNGGSKQDLMTLKVQLRRKLGLILQHQDFHTIKYFMDRIFKLHRGLVHTLKQTSKPEGLHQFLIIIFIRRARQGILAITLDLRVSPNQGNSTIGMQFSIQQKGNSSKGTILMWPPQELTSMWDQEPISQQRTQ